MRCRALLVVVPVGVLIGMLPAVASAAGGTVGQWVWPLAGSRTVARPFDPPTTPFGAGHRGADLAGRAGQDVVAAGAGRISYAGLLAGRGVVVVVHGDLRTTYEPVLTTVRVGQLVAAGEVIGRLSAGHAGCPVVCLHWGLLRGSVYLDPVRLVRAGPSRLLPLNAGPLPQVGAADGAPVAAQPLPVPAITQPAASEPIQPAGDPAFALRSADGRLGAAALLALLFGVALLRRPGRPPDDPATPAAGGGSGGAAQAADPYPTAGLVDLTRERDRRRMTIAS